MGLYRVLGQADFLPKATDDCILQRAQNRRAPPSQIAQKGRNPGALALPASRHLSTSARLNALKDRQRAEGVAYSPDLPSTATVHFSRGGYMHFSLRDTTLHKAKR